MFIVLLSFSRSLGSIVNASNHVKFISLIKQQCIIQTTLIVLHLNAYIQWLGYYPFAVNFDKCMGSRDTFNNLSNRVSIPNKTEDLDLSVFDNIAGINESKSWNMKIFCWMEIFWFMTLYTELWLAQTFAYYVQ